MDVICEQVMYVICIFVYVQIKSFAFCCSTEGLRLAGTSGCLWAQPSCSGRAPGTGSPGPCPEGFWEHLQGWRLHSSSGQPWASRICQVCMAQLSFMSWGQQISLLSLSLTSAVFPVLPIPTWTLIVLDHKNVGV